MGRKNEKNKLIVIDHSAADAANCTAALKNTFVGDFELVDMSRRRFKTKKQLAELDAAIAERERQDNRMSDANREKALQNILDLHQVGVITPARKKRERDLVRFSLKKLFCK